MLDEMTPMDPASPDVDSITPLNDSYYQAEPVKLTETEIAQIWRRIDQGIKHREKVFMPTYKSALQLWAGQHWPADQFENRWDGHLVLNIIPNTIKSLVEAVAYDLPDFTVVPRNQHGEEIQTILKSALDYWWDQSQVQRELKFATYDSKLFGVGFVQTGWLFRTEKLTLEAGRLEVLPEGVPASGALLAQEAGLLEPGTSAKDFVPEDEVIEDRFLAKRVNPAAMIVPPGATSVVDDWEWCARMVPRPLADLRRDPRFKTGRSSKTILSTKDLVGTTSLPEPYDNYDAYLPDDVQKMDEDERPPDTRFVETLEYYERDRRLHVILCREDRSRYLLCEKWTWKSKRYPFRVICNTHLPDELYGKSVPCELWHVQIELNVTRSANLEHARQFNRLYQLPEDCLSEAAKFALREGKPGGLVPYKIGPWGSNPIQPIQHPQLQPEMYRAYQWALQGAEQLSGLSQYQLAAPPTKRLTNDEAQTIAQAHGILFLADAQSFTRLAKGVAEDLLALCEQFEALIENLGVYDRDTDVKAWANFSGKEIRGNTMVSIEPGSTQPPDAQSELQQQEMVLKILLEAAQITQQSGGQLPRPIAVTMREMLRVIGCRNIDQLLPLPPVQPALPPGQPPLLPPGAAPGPSGPAGAPPALPAAAPPNTPTPAAGPPPGPLTTEQIQQALNSGDPQVIAALASLMQGHG